jgi:molybdenum-dependent DNA-binding transcriptional regulator ModE
MAYDLTDLELFLQVVDQGSITQGAERAHLSLASASARITAMEKALGAKLLDRHRRGVVPSPTGWLLVAHARAIVGQLARMRTELARCSDGLQSPLLVLANTSATQTLAPAALAFPRHSFRQTRLWWARCCPSPRLELGSSPDPWEVCSSGTSATPWAAGPPSSPRYWRWEQRPPSLESPPRENPGPTYGRSAKIGDGRRASSLGRISCELMRST